MPSAATSDPRWSEPVGEGAKRPTYCCGGCGGSAIAIVAIAVLALTSLAPFLRLDAQGRHWTRLETLDADLFAGLQTVAVGAILDALERVIDLADEFALAVTGAQLEAEFLFLGRTVVGIRK